MSIRTIPAALIVGAFLFLLPLEVRSQTGLHLEQVWVLNNGFDRPESVVFDAERDLLYVSNIEGGVNEKDEGGYISAVSLEGELIEERWVSGLNAPKGLFMSGGILYAADIDELLAIDIESAEVVGRYPAEGANFLNDVAVDAAGRVYVSDSATGGIYRLGDDLLQLWISDDRITSPNGLHAESDRLLIAAADAEAEEPGAQRYLRSVSYDDPRQIEPLYSNDPLGGLDAIESDGRGGYFLSDWPGGTVSYVTPAGEHAILEEIEQGTADLTYVADSDMIYLPLMMSNSLVAYRVIRSE